MKNLILSLVMMFSTVVSFSQIDSVSLINSYIDSLNSVRIASLEPNEKYLQTLSDVYIPSVEEWEKNPILMDIFVDFLESRYECSIGFLYEDSTNGVRDIAFWVTPNKESKFTLLILQLSELEQLYQECELINQLNEYSKWSELVINY